ncbi:MAG: sodium:solute symporter [Clostridia bacterium]|nr:sodium:solute symporter [Clostridia bacterium]
MLLRIVMVVLFFGLMVGIGLFCKRHSTNVDGFVLGGRSVGPWLTAFAYGTSYFSAVIFVGYAGQFGWKFGIASTWIGLGNAFIGSLMAWVILGRRTRIMTQHLSSATMPEFFSKRFGSDSLKLAASVIIFIFMIPYTASLYNGLSRLFEMAFHIPYIWCVAVMAVLTGIYVIAGGYMATAINDFIQGLIMLVGIVAVIAAVLSSQGGFLAALQGLSEIEDPSVALVEGQTARGVFNSFLGPEPLSLLGVVILTSLGTWGLPQMVGKFYAIKSEGAIAKGTIISTLFALVVAGGCYFLGGFGRLFTDALTVDGVAPAGGFDAIIPTMLQAALKPEGFLLTVVIILVLSASMSTLSSLVLTSSSTMTLDLIKGRVVKDMDEKKQLKVMRGLIVVFILISAVIAVYQYKAPSSNNLIAQMMGVSWGAMAGAFLAPFLYGLYWKGASKLGCWASMAFSTVVMLLNMFIRSSFPKILQSPINAGAFCMLAGFVIVPLVSLLTPKPDKALVEDAFSCYNKKVLVRQTEALGDEK